MNQESDFCYIRSVDYPDGAILPKRVARISPDDRGFYFADGVYEVIRTYQGRLFHFHDHLTRFKNSLQAVRINLPDIDRIEQICYELLRYNNLTNADAFFYIQVTRGVSPRNLLFPSPAPTPTLYISVMPITPPIAERKDGIKVITVPDIRWHRCDIKAIGLLPSVLARQAAAEAGAQEALFVRDGIVTEGTHTNLFGVKQGTVITHPLNNHILPGVTRIVLLKLCARLQLPLRETTLTESELYQQDELFVTSTTWEVVPIVEVNTKPIGSGKPGPITRKLQEEFGKYVREIVEQSNSA
ncbi:D-amino-acid transaminase [candidate division WOR-3 bacterium]|nr:D-amino-acid transaminase [candidate division WOR-3 bacterium]